MCENIFNTVNIHIKNIIIYNIKDFLSDSLAVLLLVKLILSDLYTTNMIFITIKLSIPNGSIILKKSFIDSP